MRNRHFLLGLILLGAAACNLPARDVPRGGAGGEGPRAWIDEPLEASEILLGETVPIRWHASSVNGVQQVEVRLNGASLDVASGLDQGLILVSGELEGDAAEAGEYLLEVIPTDRNGTVGEVADKHFTVLGGAVITGAVYADLNADGDAQDLAEGPLAGLTITLTECGEELGQMTDASGQFLFEDVPAGICSMDFILTGWRISGTFPAGLDLPVHVDTAASAETWFSVFMTPAPTATPTPTSTPTTIRTSTPRPATLTPTPLPPDDQGPPAPPILGPRGGISLACSTSVILDWDAPSDRSGIANYRVRLQVNSGSGWSDVMIWDPVVPTEVNADAETTCGGYYHWRVVTRDGAGNSGTVSPWAEFSILMP